MGSKRLAVSDIFRPQNLAVTMVLENKNGRRRCRKGAGLPIEQFSLPFGSWRLSRKRAPTPIALKRCSGRIIALPWRVAVGRTGSA